MELEAAGAAAAAAAAVGEKADVTNKWADFSIGLHLEFGANVNFDAD